MVTYILVTPLSSLILPKCVKTREPKDGCGVSWCTVIHVTLYPYTILRLTHTPSTAIHTINLDTHIAINTHISINQCYLQIRQGTPQLVYLYRKQMLLL